MLARSGLDEVLPFMLLMYLSMEITHYIVPVYSKGHWQPHWTWCYVKFNLKHKSIYEICLCCKCLTVENLVQTCRLRPFELNEGMSGCFRSKIGLYIIGSIHYYLLYIILFHTKCFKVASMDSCISLYDTNG